MCIRDRVSATVQIIDPNGEHSVDWSGSDESITAIDGVLTETELRFDPAALNEGSIQLVASVSDSGIADTTFTASILLKVTQQELEADGDGGQVQQISGGFGDSTNLDEETIKALVK